MMANDFDRGVALQAEFGNINTDNPDLSPFKKRGGKMLTWHGPADELIMPKAVLYAREPAHLCRELPRTAWCPIRSRL